MFKSLLKNILLIDFLSLFFWEAGSYLIKIIDPYNTNHLPMYHLLNIIFDYGMFLILPFFVAFVSVTYYLKNSNNSNAFVKSCIIPLNYGLFINFLAVANGLLTNQGDGYGWILLILVVTSVITFFSVFFINLILQFFINRKKRKYQIQ